MQADGTYVTGYNATYGTSRALLLTVDGIQFCASTATRDRGVWWKRNGKVERAPRAWAQLVSRLANASCLRDSETGHLTVNGAQLLSHFVDSHDAEGRAVAGGRPSGLHFPVIAPQRGTGPMAFIEMPKTLGTVFMTGKLEGRPVVSILS
jgi:hypothetical protein